MKHRYLIYIFSLLFVKTVLADDINTALQAYENGDYQTAYQQFTFLAENNNAEAQYNLGFMYFGGDGIEQDDEKAASWFERAAKSGHAAAQDTLAYMYLHGRGRKADRIRAYAWYNLAANNGVFLAKNISETLRRQMSATERIDAEQLSRQYLREFKQ